MAVRFLDHTPLFIDYLRKQYSFMNNVALSRHDAITAMIERGDSSIFHSINLACTEDDFVRAGKPFFNVYPRVVDALLKTPLCIRPSDIQHSVIHDIGTIVIKFHRGSAFETKYNVGWFFISLCDASPPDKPWEFRTQRRDNAIPMLSIAYTSTHFKKEGYINSWGVSMDSTFDDSNFVYLDNYDVTSEYKADCRNLRQMLASIALGVMMLAADPDFIKPVLLKADEGKTTPLEERIARAKKRGVYGFTIGEDIETCPHFRRPHFAVRWTGKGATIPKLVPVKGSVVNKKLMTTVPTGYEST